MDGVPLIVLAVYLGVLLLLGVVGYLRSRAGEEDYYLAGRSQGWIVTSLTIMATFFSSFALLGAPGKVYSEGVVFALFALNVPLSGACVWIFGRGIAREGRRRGHVTPGDMLAAHYGSDFLRVVTSLTCLLYVVPYVVMQIQAGGLLFETLVREPLLVDDSGAPLIGNFTVGAVLLASITTVYVMVGGMRSVAWTDVLQGVILTAGMLIAGAVVVVVVGPAEFSRRVGEIPEPWMTAPGPSGVFTPLMLLSICLFASTGTMVSPAQWMRFYAARSEETLRRSALIFAIVLTACFLFGVMLAGLGGHILYPPSINEAGNFVPHPDVGRADSILVVILDRELPRVWPILGVWVASIVSMAIAAASMSTADSNLHALSAVLTRDVYDRYIRPQAGPRERTLVGRAVILAATVLALVLVIGGRTDPGVDPAGTFLARSLGMIADIGLLAISFSMQLLPAAVDCLWLRRGTAVGISAGILTGHAVTVVARQTGLGGVLEGVWGLAANVAVAAALGWMLTRGSRRRRPGE